MYIKGSACLLVLLYCSLIVANGADYAAAEEPNIIQVGLETVESAFNDTVHHILLNNGAEIIQGIISGGAAEIEAKVHPKTSSPAAQSTTPEVMTSNPPGTTPAPVTTLATTTAAPTSTPLATTPLPSSTPSNVMTSNPPSTTLAPLSTLVVYTTPAPVTSLVTTTLIPTSTPTATTPVPSSTPFTNPCLITPGAGVCYVNATTKADLSNTTVDVCADPTTCQCLPTSTRTLCTSTTGLCVNTPTNYTQCGPFANCTAPPETLGFESPNATAGGVSNPFSYAGLVFTASLSTGGPPFRQGTSLTVVTTNTENLPSIKTGSQALEATYSNFNTASTITVSDSNANTTGGPGGTFIPVSAYVNAVSTDGTGTLVQISGTTGGSLVTCPTQSFTANGEAGVPTRVLFGGGGGCTVDALSFNTPNAVVGTGFDSNYISLDDFVVCKANPLSGLVPIID